jgi:hypothetical protein
MRGINFNSQTQRKQKESLGAKLPEFPILGQFIKRWSNSFLLGRICGGNKLKKKREALGIKLGTIKQSTTIK